MWQPLNLLFSQSSGHPRPATCHLPLASERTGGLQDGTLKPVEPGAKPSRLDSEVGWTDLQDIQLLSGVWRAGAGGDPIVGTHRK